MASVRPRRERTKSLMFQLLLQCLYLLPLFINVNSETHIKYILEWTKGIDDQPFPEMGEGPDIFLKRNCSYNNCFITSNRDYLDDYTEFDVILFNSRKVSKMMGRVGWPQRRDPAQKYVFVSIESADNYPVCTDLYDNFFNWTWTYKFNSDIQFPYMTIRDKQHKVIGPKPGIQWLSIEDMDDVNKEIKLRLKRKTKLVAWFVSNWFSRSPRNSYCLELNNLLRHWGYSIDIYGKFEILKCEDCLNMLEKDYYFYLSFENSLCEDYVTEKLLQPLLYYTVPVVYGIADYSRFLPKGSYLNAIELGVQNVATIMINAMKDPEQYYKFFKWHNHYSYHRTSESPDTDVYCNFCKRINNKKLMEKHTTVKKFKKWWTPESRCIFNKT